MREAPGISGMFYSLISARVYDVLSVWKLIVLYTYDCVLFCMFIIFMEIVF